MMHQTNNKLKYTRIKPVYLCICLTVPPYPISQKVKKKVTVKNDSILFLFFSSLSYLESFVKIKLVYCNLKVFLTTLIQRHHQTTSWWSVYPKFNKIPHT